jgi:mycofactocin precursor
MTVSRGQSARDAEITVPAMPDGNGPEESGGEGELIVEDLLVDDVSIDGMCGVY